MDQAGYPRGEVASAERKARPRYPRRGTRSRTCGLAEGPILAIVRAIDRPDAALRATLAGSQFIRLAMARYVVGVGPLASADRELLVKAIGPTIQRYLTGDLGAD